MSVCKSIHIYTYIILLNSDAKYVPVSYTYICIYECVVYICIDVHI